ncbi:rhodanese-like domain-containing protein [Pseudobacteriovorax antillogorgiicola]|uniref:Rhodanese-related sulfurtransferase n=1 Tax=Pseudobacteriovorax antillogorgiicola TaxID=1513793 RepID=A0A1Y6C8S8_9BACT|nr:rhodanese-like domain-containing protein [Pseudobacteriovorax antillogorgiicola]TCS49091.1 rhodanese-related sulfurtransferase [Pseudobacteriovorax antillogorgiicola]SMF51823.1 Rhodanese-related sulfurtransferase [Pseudobacteriovorax antillogorgiicola]
MKLSIVIALLLAADAYGKTWQKFCEEVPDWPKGSVVPGDEAYKGVAKPVDGAFTKGKWDMMKKGSSSEKWIIIDARSKSDRGVGKIPKSAMITADYKDDSKNQFKEKTIVKKVNKMLKSSYGSLADMKDVRFILFCNGKKCHRSSFGACEMRKMGVPENQLFVMLGGFPEWKDRNYPTR